MDTPAEIDLAKRRIVVRVNEVEALARSLYPTYAAFGRPSVGFFRAGLRAGTCNFAKNRYQFNLSQAVQNDSIERLTVPHEIAHMVAKRVYGASGHGHVWRSICIALGGDGQRCYSAKARGVTVQRARRKVEYLYSDSRGVDQWVGPVHHKRLQQRGGELHESNCYRLVTPSGSRIAKTGFKGSHRIVA